MSELTDWEPEINESFNWKERYEGQLALSNKWLREVSELKASYQKLVRENLSLCNQRLDEKKALAQQFTAIQSEAIIALKAIAICINASIPNEHSQERLTHRARNFRMKHIDRIIADQIAKLGDRKLSSYEDDF